MGGLRGSIPNMSRGIGTSSLSLHSGENCNKNARSYLNFPGGLSRFSDVEGGEMLLEYVVALISSTGLAVFRSELKADGAVCVGDKLFCCDLDSGLPALTGKCS